MAQLVSYSLENYLSIFENQKSGWFTQSSGANLVGGIGVWTSNA